MQTAFDGNKSAGERRKVRYTCALPTKSDRDWNFTVEDIIRIVISSDKNRYQVMCAVCPTTGVAVPRWIRARQGHSLQFIDSMRTSFHLFQTGVETGASSASATYQHRCNMFDSIGNAVHHTNHRAARGIEKRLFPRGWLRWTNSHNVQRFWAGRQMRQRTSIKIVRRRTRQH
jgi:hypothetical protein